MNGGRDPFCPVERANDVPSLEACDLFFGSSNQLYKNRAV